MIYETQEQLDAAVKEWQKVLQLQDWDVKGSIVRKRDLMLEDVGACIRWQIQGKLATMQLMDPIDWEPTEWEQDHEEYLVHELLHLHYAPFDMTESGSLEQAMLEQSINAISRALVALKRGGGTYKEEKVLTGKGLVPMGRLQD